MVEPAEDPVPCTKCELVFPSWVAFHQHKVRSKNHITCEACSQDFNTHEAAKQHHDLMHSHEQNLKCPGCGEVFTRLGGLVSHIELTECHSIPKKRFDSARNEKNEWHKNYRHAHTQQAYREPAPAATVAPLTYQDDNLISFDEPSAILNSAWGVPYVPPTAAAASSSATTRPQSPPAVNSPNDFPALGKTSVKTSVKTSAIPPVRTHENAWASQQKLFPNAPAPVAPPVELMASLAVGGKPASAVEDPAQNEHDPDAPGFKVSKYYVQITGKYKCPHLGCNKSMEKTNAFIQHLKSPAHRNEKLQCNKCLRYYMSATALTQHSESQGVRCKVRETSGYGGIIDKITGGTATVAGRHKDDTLKYAVVDPNFKPDASGASGATFIAEANKKAGAVIQEAKDNYWKSNAPKW